MDRDRYEQVTLSLWLRLFADSTTEQRNSKKKNTQTIDDYCKCRTHAAVAIVALSEM